jgi:hypothetical protein
LLLRPEGPAQKPVCRIFGADYTHNPIPASRPDCAPQMRLRVRSSKSRLGANLRAKGPIHTSLGQRPKKEGLCFLIRAESPLHFGLMEQAFSPLIRLKSRFPGALPQADMVPRLNFGALQKGQSRHVCQPFAHSVTCVPQSGLTAGPIQCRSFGPDCKPARVL